MRKLSYAMAALCLLLPATLLRGPSPDLNWIAGHWQGEAWGGQFSAHYIVAECGMVISYSKLTRDGETSYYEFEVFEPEGDGMRLSPHPGGKKADGFRLSSHDAADQRAVFENPDKDYPTRIVYHRDGDTRLVISLDDPHGDSGKSEVFDLAMVHDD